MGFHASMAVVLVASACGGGEGRPADSGVAFDAPTFDNDADPPEPRAIPRIDWVDQGAPPIETPSFGPCPEGWRERIIADDVRACDPWPEGGPEACAAASSAHFVGGPGCERIGPAFPREGDFAQDLPADRPIVYVRPSAEGGDGSESLPYGTIDAAMRDAAPGTVVALSRGTFDEAVRVARGVTLWGACTQETVITTSGPSAIGAVVGVRLPDVAMRSLRIANAPRLGIGVGAPGSLDVRDAW